MAWRSLTKTLERRVGRTRKLTDICFALCTLTFMEVACPPTFRLWVLVSLFITLLFYRFFLTAKELRQEAFPCCILHDTNVKIIDEINIKVRTKLAIDKSSILTIL